MGLFSFFKKDNSLDAYNQLFTPGRPQRNAPPKTSGWYRLKNKITGDYDYTGISNNLERRAKEHMKTGKFKPDKHWFEFKSEDVPYDMLRAKEVAKIKKYNVPKLNKNLGGGGRPPKQLIKNVDSNKMSKAGLAGLAVIAVAWGVNKLWNKLNE